MDNYVKLTCFVYENIAFISNYAYDNNYTTSDAVDFVNINYNH